MKEARIVMPAGSLHAHQIMAEQLIDAFGGYTSVAGSGGWDSGTEVSTEPVVVYDVAMEDTDANVDRLGEIALDAARALRQKAVYIRRPDGEVLILDVAKETAKREVVRLGIKRTPKPNEVWKTRGGGEALVLAEFKDAGGRLHLNCVLVSRGDAAVATPHRFTTSDSGAVRPGKVHTFDLVRFDRTF